MICRRLAWNSVTFDRPLTRFNFLQDLPVLPQPERLRDDDQEAEAEDEEAVGEEAIEDNTPRNPWRWVVQAREARREVSFEQQHGVGLRGVLKLLEEKKEPENADTEHGDCRECFLRVYGEPGDIKQDLKNIAKALKMQQPPIREEADYLSVSFTHWRTREKFEGFLSHYEARRSPNDSLDPESCTPFHRKIRFFTLVGRTQSSNKVKAPSPKA